jgi:hypothetical protein
MTTGRRGWRSAAAPAAMPAAMRMRAAEPTLVPPNFITSRSFN